eukprot:g5191.t1
MSFSASFDTGDWKHLSREQLLETLKDVHAKFTLERRRSGSFAEELRLAKEQNLITQAKIEQEEECISNKLFKRLEKLKNEKQLLANEVEQEEEFLTNTLQKKLEKLNKEKVDLENQLETEQEYIVNKLQKQLEFLNSEKKKLTREKVDLENQLEAEQELIVNKLQKQVEKLDLEKRKLQLEKVNLQRQVNDLNQSVEKLNREKVNLESTMEMEEENIVNRMQKQLDIVLAKYHLLESKLKDKGIRLCDIGVEPITIDAIRRSLSASQSPRIEYSSSFTGRGSDWTGIRRNAHLERRALSSKMRENLEGRFE